MGWVESVIQTLVAQVIERAKGWRRADGFSKYLAKKGRTKAMGTATIAYDPRQHSNLVATVIGRAVPAFDSPSLSESDITRSSNLRGRFVAQVTSFKSAMILRDRLDYYCAGERFKS